MSGIELAEVAVAAEGDERGQVGAGGAVVTPRRAPRLAELDDRAERVDPAERVEGEPLDR
jgi:hypothetical protein